MNDDGVNDAVAMANAFRAANVSNVVSFGGNGPRDSIGFPWRLWCITLTDYSFTLLG